QTEGTLHCPGRGACGSVRPAELYPLWQAHILFHRASEIATTKAERRYTMMTRTFLGLMSAMALSYAAVADENTTTKDGDSMKIIVKVGDKALTATLIDSKTAKDLVSLLPLTLTMNDLFGREK